MIPLTRGAIEIINSGKTFDDPVLKVLGYKIVPSGSSGQNRYRLLLSDGVKTHSFAMLATQLNHLIENGDLVNNTVVRIRKYVCNNVQNNKYVLIVLDAEIIGVDLDEPPAEGPPFQNVVENIPEVKQKPPETSLRICVRTPPKLVGNGPFSDGHSSTPGTPNSGLPKIFPIQSLNPYQNRWTVRARISQKAPIRTWNKQGREGKLFSFTIVDESGEIRVTAFNAEVDKFYDIIEVNKIFYITRANLKAANKQYNTTNNDYEMTLNADSQIISCEDEDVTSIPETHFTFVPIGKLDTVNPGAFVDIVGVVHEAGELQTITTKTTQREVRKRELGIVDTSKCLVRLTLWDAEAANFDASSHPAVVVKAAKVSDFNGRSLSVGQASTLIIAPTTVPEAIRLKGWYELEGRLGNFETYQNDMAMGGSSMAGGSATGSGVGNASSLGSWNLLHDLKSPGVGLNAKPDYFTCKSTVVFLKKENFMYQACACEGCNKKVVDLGNGLYRCEKCARESPEFKWRLLLMVKLADATGDCWVTCFQEAAELLLGQSADGLGAMKEAQDDSQLERVFMDAVFKSWLFRLRAKIDRYNDEERLRVVVADVKPLDYMDYCKRLAKSINELARLLPEEVDQYST